MLVLGASALDKQQPYCYFEKNFSNSEKTLNLKPDGCHGPPGVLGGRWYKRKTESWAMDRERLVINLKCSLSGIL